MAQRVLNKNTHIRVINNPNHIKERFADFLNLFIRLLIAYNFIFMIIILLYFNGGFNK